MQSSKLFGVIRDDVSSRTVHGFLTGSEVLLNCLDVPPDYLLYDFGLTVGDTLQDCYISDPGHAVIRSDSFEEHFGAPRRTLKSDDYRYSLIEGIGYWPGLFLAAENLISAGKGIAMYDFCIGTLWECGLRTDTEDLTQDIFTVYPNPTQGTLTLSTKADIKELSLLDVMARPCANLDVRHALDLSAHPAGLYLLRAEDKEGRVQVERVVKL